MKNPVTTENSPLVAEVRGDGVLADAVRAELADLMNVTSPSVLFTVSDKWASTHLDAAGDRPQLGVHTELGRVIIGPMKLPGEPGCPRCADVRRTEARVERDIYARLIREHRAALEDQPSRWLTRQAGKLVAVLVADEYQRCATGRQPRTVRALLIIDLADLTVSRHPFLPVPGCACHPLPVDTPEVTQITPRSEPFVGLGAFRTRNIMTDRERLKSTYVDSETGLIAVLRRTYTDVLPRTSAQFRRPNGALESSAGRGRRFPDTEVVAILEALERYANLCPRGRRTTVRGSYAELASVALDPRSTGLPAQAAYDADDKLQPFTPDTPCTWVWGFSMIQRRPILVPETLVYFGLPPATHTRFVHETSNGTALGASKEEAALHALLEVIERDAFLITWYGSLPVPELDVDTFSTDARLIVAGLRERGFDARVFDTTMEHGVPSVCALGVNVETDWPKAAVAAAAHPVPGTAVLAALTEVSAMLAHNSESSEQPEYRQRCADLAANPSSVRLLIDHANMYFAPEAFDRLRFLTETRATLRRVPETPARFDAITDISKALTTIVSMLGDSGMESVIVDLTGPEHTAADLCCVRAVVTGAVPLAFGHANRRVEGIPRLLSVPHRLGYTARPLTTAELNQDPHPFA
ncbi:TOMM precursor leader peptide-binding protein [Nocardia sp. NPDC019219]|uniref:TOMM precursor leader peptide-binding protein n=1 Tax=Nocardia sp. NPDC019219 TaxID=3154590 RepID=UPI0033F16EDB